MDRYIEICFLQKEVAMKIVKVVLECIGQILIL